MIQTILLLICSVLLLGCGTITEKEARLKLKSEAEIQLVAACECIRALDVIGDEWIEMKSKCAGTGFNSLFKVARENHKIDDLYPELFDEIVEGYYEKANECVN